MTEETPTVLVVDDQEDVTDLFAAMLEDRYDVRTAYGGEEALEKMDGSVDVVLLDRKMPGLSGDEVLEEIRGRGFDARVAMVTAVMPDFDIIDMGFDDYVVKPVKKQELVETVEKLIRRSDYDDRLREYFSLLSKQAALEEQKSDAELEGSEEYAEMEERLEELSGSLDAALSELVERDGYGEAFRGLGTG